MTAHYSTTLHRFTFLWKLFHAVLANRIVCKMAPAHARPEVDITDMDEDHVKFVLKKTNLAYVSTNGLSVCNGLASLFLARMLILDLILF